MERRSHKRGVEKGTKREKFNGAGVIGRQRGGMDGASQRNKGLHIQQGLYENAMKKCNLLYANLKLKKI